jgi:hypothetical protein
LRLRSRRALLQRAADFERAPQVRNEFVQQIAIVVVEARASARSREAEIVRETVNVNVPARDLWISPHHAMFLDAC